MWGCHGASLRGCFFAGALYDGKMKTEHCCKCRIKGCIEDKGLAYCYECPEHPCRLTKDLEKSYKKRYQISLVENSDHLIAPSLRWERVPLSFSTQPSVVFGSLVISTKRWRVAAVTT